MRSGVLGVLALCVGMTLVSDAGAAAPSTYVVSGSFSGTSQLQIVDGCSGGMQFHLNGNGEITPFGTSSFVAIICTATAGNSFVLRASDGTVSGPIPHVSTSGPRTLDLAVAVTDGTGRYVGANGSITVNATMSSTDQTISGTVNGTVMFGPPVATTKSDCTKGGWQHVVNAHGNTFKNQGDCISSVVHDTNH